MWRVTLNCSGSQTPWAARPPAFPQPLYFPARAHARHAPKPETAHPSWSLSLPCRKTPGSCRGPNRRAQLVEEPRSEPQETRHRCPSPGTLSGTDAAARLGRPAPSSPPLSSPPRRPSRHYLGAAPRGRRAASSSLPCAFCLWGRRPQAPDPPPPPGR